MLKKIYLIYLLLGIPKIYLFSLILIIRSLFDKKFSLTFLYKNKFYLQIICLTIFIFFELFKINFLENFNYENLKSFYVYIVLFISLIYFQKYNIYKPYTIDLLFKLLIFYFLYVLSVIILNNIVLNCYISKAGYFDLFQIVENKFIFLNLNNYNCEINNPYKLFSHITSFQFKISLLSFIGILIIFNSNRETYIFFSLFVILFCHIFLFELGSRGLFLLLQILNITVLIYFILKKKYKILILYFISIVIISLGLIKNYEKSFVNIFNSNETNFLIEFSKSSNHNYKYWYSEDLVQRYLNFKNSKSRVNYHNFLLQKKKILQKKNWLY